MGESLFESPCWCFAYIRLGLEAGFGGVSPDGEGGNGGNGDK